jgi:putative ABC transport system permease protein
VAGRPAPQVAARAREIATLRALGFNSGAVLVSALAESLALAALGGIAGGLLAYAGFNGYQTSTIYFQTFSQVAFAFRVTPELLVLGLVWLLGMGLVGGLLPAVRASRLPISGTTGTTGTSDRAGRAAG